MTTVVGWPELWGTGLAWAEPPWPSCGGWAVGEWTAATEGRGSPTGGPICQSTSLRAERERERWRGAGEQVGLVR